MGFGERLKELREAKGMTQKEFASLVHVSSSAISHFENSSNFPKPSVLIGIMGVLECDANYLYQDYIDQSTEIEKSIEEYELIKKYRALTPHGKELVQTVMDLEYKESIQSLNKKNLMPITMYEPVLQKNGYALKSKTQKIFILPSPFNLQADFCYRILNNQANPTYCLGDVALVKKERVSHNQLGLFEVNGHVHMKKLFEYKGKIKLIPINISVSPIEVKDRSELKTLGRIIGKLEGDYIK